MARDLNDTIVFVKVVEQGSFIAAAKTLRLPKTTVSRKVQELEARLGAQLLHRTTRKLGLTEAGNVYYEHSQRIARELDRSEEHTSELQSLMRNSYHVFCLKKKNTQHITQPTSLNRNYIHRYALINNTNHLHHQH